MKKRKRPLTLLEIVIAMVLLGFLLTGLFNIYHKALRQEIQARELKQQVLRLEFIEHKVKHLFTHATKLYSSLHPDALGEALFLSFHSGVDPDLSRSERELLGMLYLNKNKELSLVSWSLEGTPRKEILLDAIHCMQWRFFDPKKREWQGSWPSKSESAPVMVSLDLTWKGETIPFVFFSELSSDPISYLGVSQ